MTGNFHAGLQIVLKDFGVADKVTFEIKPKSMLSDRRHVEFRINDNAEMDRSKFNEIMRAIKSRIGRDPTPRWWTRPFRSSCEAERTFGSSNPAPKNGEAGR